MRGEDLRWSLVMLARVFSVEWIEQSPCAFFQRVKGENSKWETEMGVWVIHSHEKTEVKTDRLEWYIKSDRRQSNKNKIQGKELIIQSKTPKELQEDPIHEGLASWFLESWQMLAHIILSKLFCNYLNYYCMTFLLIFLIKLRMLADSKLSKYLSLRCKGSVIDVLLQKTIHETPVNKLIVNLYFTKALIINDQGQHEILHKQ